MKLSSEIRTEILYVKINYIGRAYVVEPVPMILLIGRIIRTEALEKWASKLVSIKDLCINTCVILSKYDIREYLFDRKQGSKSLNQVLKRGLNSQN